MDPVEERIKLWKYQGYAETWIRESIIEEYNRVYDEQNILEHEFVCLCSSSSRIDLIRKYVSDNKNKTELFTAALNEVYPNTGDEVKIDQYTNLEKFKILVEAGADTSSYNQSRIAYTDHTAVMKYVKENFGPFEFSDLELLKDSLLGDNPRMFEYLYRDEYLEDIVEYIFQGDYVYDPIKCFRFLYSEIDKDKLEEYLEMAENCEYECISEFLKEEIENKVDPLDF